MLTTTPSLVPGLADQLSLVRQKQDDICPCPDFGISSTSTAVYQSRERNHSFSSADSFDSAADVSASAVDGTDGKNFEYPFPGLVLEEDYTLMYNLWLLPSDHYQEVAMEPNPIFSGLCQSQPIFPQSFENQVRSKLSLQRILPFNAMMI